MVYGAKIVFFFFFGKSYKTHKCSLWTEQRILSVKNQNGILYNVIKPNKHDGKKVQKGDFIILSFLKRKNSKFMKSSGCLCVFPFNTISNF